MLPTNDRSAHAIPLKRKLKSDPAAIWLLALSMLIGGCARVPGAPASGAPPAARNNAPSTGASTGPSVQPEAGSGFTARQTVSAERFIVATANPLATRSAFNTLRQGGSAVDAAIAAQMVLALVEPQSSGIGGGAFALFYDGQTAKVRAFDGRETAPAQASEQLFMDSQGVPLPFYRAAIGGRSVGVPGVVAMLELMHRQSGKLPWKSLFDDAISLAEQGFAVSARLNALISGDRYLLQDPQAARYFFDAAGTARPVGYLLANPELAAMLRAIADQGARALSTGSAARDIVQKVRGHPSNPGLLSEADLAGYAAKERTPLCGPYLRYLVCTVPPPSSGGVTTLQMLAMLESLARERGPLPLADQAGLAAPGLHRFTEVGRLAFADRNRFLADPDFVTWPAGLLDADYLAERARTIDDAQSHGLVAAGRPPGVWLALAEGAQFEEAGTSHLSIVDAEGNAVAMTTTIETAFGAHLMVRGFLLNNQLTDFSFAPVEQGLPVANRVQPGKRPRSAMAPTLVFDRGPTGAPGTLLITLGAAGGSPIINYVAKTLVATLADGVDLQSAIALPNAGSRNGPTDLEKDRVPAALADELRALGHQVNFFELTSGLHGIMRVCERSRCRWVGGADPRREGSVMGE